MIRRTRWGFALLAFIVAGCLWALYPPADRIKRGIDLEGGTELVYRIQRPDMAVAMGTELAEGVQDAIGSRLDERGLKEISISVTGPDKLVIQIPGVSGPEVEGIMDLIEQAGVLNFHLVADDEEQTEENLDKYELQGPEWTAYRDKLDAWRSTRDAWEKGGKQGPEPEPPAEPERLTVPDRPIRGKVTGLYKDRLVDDTKSWTLDEFVKTRSLLVPDRDKEESFLIDGNDAYSLTVKGVEDLRTLTQVGKTYLIRRYRRTLLLNDEPNRLSGKLVKGAYYTHDENNNPAVGFEMKSKGAAKMGDLTAEKNKGRLLAIVLDRELVSSPVIEATITTHGIIRGRFTPDEVKNMVTVLNVGSLPAKPYLEHRQTVGAVMGQDSLRNGTYAILLGLVIVMAIIAVYYISSGWVADLALLINITLILGFVALFRQTLTFPGIAGILLTVGMSIDANIIIFERVREELAKGKSTLQSLANGYQRAFWAIFDANLTTLVTAVALYKFGTPSIKGYAITLSAGIVASFFTAVYVTRLILSFLYNIGFKLIRDFRMLEAFRPPHINYLSRQRTFIAGSILVILFGFVAMGIRGRELLGIDFTGGSRLVVNLVRGMRIEDFRRIVGGITVDEKRIFQQATIQTLGEIDSDGQARSFSIRVRQAEEGVAEAQEPAVVPEDDEAGARTAVKSPHDFLKDELERTLDREGLLAPREFPEEGQRAPKTLPVADPSLQEIYLVANLLVPPSALPPDPEKLYDRLKEEEEREDRPLFPQRWGIRVADVRKLDDRSTATVAAFEIVTSPVTWPPPRERGPETVEDVTLRIKSFLSDWKRWPVYRPSSPFPTVEGIGRRVASSFQGNALIALFISLIGIVFYMSLRFDFNYGVAAVVALAHDAVVSLGLLVVTDMAIGEENFLTAMLGETYPMKVDLSVIAALLTIIGYSVNDTIIVFDRVRENARNMKRKEEYEEIVNRSVNQTLPRTIWTSLTTWIVVLTLLILGGEPVRAFTYTLLIGVITGSYSTVFIASPVLIHLRKRSLRRKARRQEEAVARA